MFFLLLLIYLLVHYIIITTASMILAWINAEKVCCLFNIYKMSIIQIFFLIKNFIFFFFTQTFLVFCFQYIDAAEFSLKILELFNRGYLRECAKYANLSHLCVRNRFSRSNGNILLPLNVHHLSCLMITITISTLSSFIWAFIICSLTFR